MNGPQLCRAWLRGALDWASTYLPVLLMGLLAMGTWWLVKNTPLFEAQRPPEAPRHEPDYTMAHFTVRRFDAQGELRTQVRGDQARHYPDTDLLEVDNVRLRAIGLKGEITTAEANRGWSNHDGSELRLQGEAVVERAATELEPAVVFHGESLLALVKAQQVESKEPVTIDRAEMHVVADTMHYDHQTHVAQTQGRVHATFTGAGNHK
jgi:lipopolysaccharide export system protein LptC